jgi:hypothetical protein
VYCHIGNGMETANLIVEVHFVSLAAREAEERKQRLHTLFLTAALRLARNGSGEAKELAREAISL